MQLEVKTPTNSKKTLRMREIPTIIIILGIAAIIVGSIGLALFSRTTLPPGSAEGFRASGAIQGELPMAAQSSFIPQDSAAATTANPELAKPNITDFVDSRDSFKYFLDIYSPEAAAGANLGSTKKSAIADMLLTAPRALQNIEDFILRPETIPSAEVIEQAAEARRLADAMRRVGPMDPVDVGWERPGCISYRNDNLLSM